MNKRKTLLVSVIFLSYIPILTASISKLIISSNPLEILLNIASFCGLIGAVVLFWQFILGFRDFVGKFITDLVWVNKIHKKFGMYGPIFIFIHPLLLVFAYSQLGINLLNFNFNTDFERLVFLGKISITLVATVWITSALFRKKLAWKWWRRIHWITYPALPLILIHSNNLGLIVNTSFLKIYWLILTIVYIVAITIRIFIFFGFTKSIYYLEKVKPETDLVNSYYFHPKRNWWIKPKPGQFVYIQNKTFENPHPFTVTSFDEQTGTISISPKIAGNFTKMLSFAAIGSEFKFDGPFGVFLADAALNDKTTVFIAGGIGITPFMRFIRSYPQKKITLIYGNRTKKDIAFFDELNEIAQKNLGLKIIHFLSEDSTLDEYPGSNFEQGFVTVEKIQEILGDQFQTSTYYLCGPDVMIKNLEQQLKLSGINSYQDEVFSL